MTADPKPAKRIRVTPREWNRLHDEKGGPCRLCGDRKYELHHLVGRDLGGDDVANNLVPLCRDHHRAVQELEQPASAELGRKLTPGERSYVMLKKGQDFFARYFREEAA